MAIRCDYSSSSSPGSRGARRSICRKIGAAHAQLLSRHASNQISQDLSYCWRFRDQWTITHRKIASDDAAVTVDEAICKSVSAISKCPRGGRSIRGGRRFHSGDSTRRAARSDKSASESACCIPHVLIDILSLAEDDFCLGLATGVELHQEWDTTELVAYGWTNRRRTKCQHAMSRLS